MVTDLPKYMTDVLKFNIAATGTLTAIPYLAMWMSSFVFGWACDLCVSRKWHSIKMGRIIHTTIGETNENCNYYIIQQFSNSVIQFCITGNSIQFKFLIIVFVVFSCRRLLSVYA